VPSATSAERAIQRTRLFVNELLETYNKSQRNPAFPAARYIRDIAVIAGVGQINITIDEKGFAQVPIGEFAQVILPYGQHELTLSHRDLIDMKSTHHLKVDKPVHRIVIYPTVGTHYFELTDASTPLSGYAEIK